MKELSESVTLLSGCTGVHSDDIHSLLRTDALSEAYDLRREVADFAVDILSKDPEHCLRIGEGLGQTEGEALLQGAVILGCYNWDI